MRAAVVGLGAVGETCAQALVASDVVRRLVLLNRTIDLADMIARDLRQARSWGRRLETEVGTTADGRLLEGCNLIVLTLGPRLRGGQNRQDVAAAAVDMYQRARLVEALATGVAEDGQTCVLLVTNPVEIMVTWLAAKSGIPRTRLFGLGTTVESARCSDHLARRLDVDAVSAWVHLLGEHGQGTVLLDGGRLAGMVEPAALRRDVNLARKRALHDAELIRRISEDLGQRAARRLCERLPERLGQVERPEVLESFEAELAAELTPPATRFAIAACVVEVARALASDSDRVMTLSTLPPSDLGLPPVALSLPYAVRRGGLGRCLLHEASEELRSVANRLYAVFQALPT